MSATKWKSYTHRWIIRQSGHRHVKPPHQAHKAAEWKRFSLFVVIMGFQSCCSCFVSLSSCCESLCSCFESLCICFEFLCSCYVFPCRCFASLRLFCFSVKLFKSQCSCFELLYSRFASLVVILLTFKRQKMLIVTSKRHLVPMALCLLGPLSNPSMLAV